MIDKNTITVIGIGRVGLPMALVLAEAGNKVFGIGRDEKKMALLQKGKMPFREKGALTLLRKHVDKNFYPTISYDSVKKSKYIIITLGTPVDENMNPSFNQIDTVIENMLSFLQKGQVLILRSTVTPRSTQYVKTIIEKMRKFKVGRDFFIAFCPERISEGNAIEEIVTIPQIIGGVDKRSGIEAELLFKKLKVKTVISDDTSAELAKLFTNMYRYINFAIANEFMLLAHNYHRDIYEIVDLVNKNYKRGGLSLPGLTAGPCLFKDGFFLINDIPYTELISTSWKINESVPLFLIRLIRERVKLKNKKVIIYGLAFKGEIDDIRESLSFKARKALIREGAEVYLHDPFVDYYKGEDIEKDLYKLSKNADIIFIATNHKIYRDIDIKRLKSLVKKSCLVCDVWNVMNTNRILFKINNLQ